MQCPHCGAAGRIERAYTQVEGDQSPDTPTKVYTVQEIACRNPACPRRGQTVATLRHLDYEG